MVERRNRARRDGFLAVAFAVALAACSGSGDTNSAPTSASDAETSVTTDVDDPFVEVPVDSAEVTSGPGEASGDVSAPTPTTDPPVEGTPDAPPVDDGATSTTVAPVPVPDPDSIERIISLSPSHTETLFALGLGELVVGVDSRSDFPDEARALGDPALDVSVSTLDAVLSYDPDLVIIGDDPTGMAGRLAAADIASYVGPQPDSLGEVYDQIDDIAGLLGRSDRGDELIGNMRADVESIQASLPTGAAGLTVFHEIDPSLFTPSGQSFFSDLYVAIGLTNIAGPAESGRVTQLTNDELIAADPDVIVLADVDCCGVTPERVAARPGWAEVSAVESGAIVAVPDPIIMRWGPRIVELLRLVAGGVVTAAS